MTEIWDPADPFPMFERLRTTAPVSWSERWRRFVVTRHREVVTVLRSPEVYSSRVVPQVPPADRELLARFTDWSARWLFFLDPPEHAARRAPVARALSPRAVAGVTTEAGALLDALRGNEFDVLADFAHPLAARVVAGLLCAPGAETDAFLARALALERADADARDPLARRAGLTAMAEATEALRSADVRAPVPSALRAAWGADDDTVGAHSLMLLFAGVETTQNLIVNTVHTLLREPGRWQASPGAVEEATRLAPPVLGVLRRATRDVVLAGQRIAAGTELMVMTAAANRDPERFTDPDRFDPGRSPNPHLSYGLGPHYCPGAALTRLTVHAAVGALADRFPALTLTGPGPSWRTHDPIVHAPAALRVRAAVRRT